MHSIPIKTFLRFSREELRDFLEGIGINNDNSLLEWFDDHRNCNHLDALGMISGYKEGRGIKKKGQIPLSLQISTYGPKTFQFALSYIKKDFIPGEPVESVYVVFNYETKTIRRILHYVYGEVIWVHDLNSVAWSW